MKVQPRAFIKPEETKGLFSGDGSIRCLTCRGRKNLCGKNQCPILVRYYSSQKVNNLINSTHLDGSSPPSVFIGRWGYPKVNIGPLVPPQRGNTSLMDTPEEWQNITIDNFVEFRSSLVRGKFRVNVHNLNMNRMVEDIREIALAKNPVDMEVNFLKAPRGTIALYDEVQPHGPSASLMDMSFDNPKMDQCVEKAFYDGDLTAKDAVMRLYGSGIRISRLQKGFSVGAFGIEKMRRFVPTRWSITAVDSTIGDELKKQVYNHSLINDFRVYETMSLDNRWVILMFPSSWQYELIEAWYPSTTWNPSTQKIVIFGDHEFHQGKNTYATIGGCYYAARLAVAEALHREKKQAGIVVLREAHPGYIMPVGVWNVRENVRRALQKPPFLFDTFHDALSSISKFMDIPIKRWIETSVILRDKIYQKRITDF